MKISVVTAVYNGRKYIRDTIESVLAQQGDFELEYLIRDGGSTDGTVEIIREYASDPRLSWVSQPDRGPQDAINAGMAAATGEIGCWLNADDLYEPGALQKVSEVFAAQPATQWLYGRCRMVDGSGQAIRKAITVYKNLLGYRFFRSVLLTENFINQPATFWRMDFWRGFGGLQSKYKAAWDYELWLDFAQKSAPVHLRENLAIFRRHDESISEVHTCRQFHEELEICGTRTKGVLYFIHWLNIKKILFVYRLLSG